MSDARVCSVGEWSYPGWPLEVQGRTGEECGRMGVELFIEDEHEGEEKEGVPGDWVLVLDEQEDPGVPKGLESSTEVIKTNIIAYNLVLVICAKSFSEGKHFKH